ncbi:MAG: Crossover junction endodeoxyribonuclease RuvC [Pseudomonadota bacterium]
MNEYRHLLAVDPSLTCSGWVLFRVRDGEVTSAGKIRSAPPSVPLAERLKGVQANIEMVLQRLNLGSNDVLVCEAPTTMKDPHNALKVEQVRSMFESLARTRQVTVPGRVAARSVHFEVMGLVGKQIPRGEVKATAVRTAEYLYAEPLRRLGLLREDVPLKKHQDIVDALLIGRLALSRIQAAQDAAVPLENMFQTQARTNRNSWRVRGCTR